MSDKKPKKFRCPGCGRAQDPKYLAPVGGTFICVSCGEEFELDESRLK